MRRGRECVRRSVTDKEATRRRRREETERERREKRKRRGTVRAELKNLEETSARIEHVMGIGLKKLPKPASSPWHWELSGHCAWQCLMG